MGSQAELECQCRAKTVFSFKPPRTEGKTQIEVTCQECYSLWQATFKDTSGQVQFQLKLMRPSARLFEINKTKGPEAFGVGPLLKK